MCPVIDGREDSLSTVLVSGVTLQLPSRSESTNFKIMLAALTIQVLLVSLAYGDVSEKLRLGLLPSSSNYPGLQAPLEGAAASSVPNIYRTHGPNDEDNLERLCNDPFHSFLCKPVTPRRSRIDGKLRPSAVIPPGILPAASNLQEFSQPLESGKDLLRNTKSYLPPPHKKVVQIGTEPHYEPPHLSSHKSLTNNFEEKPKKQIENSSQKLKQTPLRQLSRKYLPIDESNVSADSTNLSPSIENLSLLGSAAQIRENKDEHHSLERLCNDPFHSFLCKPGKRRKRIDGRLREGAKIPPNVLIGASSIVREARVLPSQPGSAQVASKRGSISLNYLPTNTDKSTPIFTTHHTTTYPPQQTYIPSQGPSGGYHYPQPSNNQIFTYPTSSTTSTTTRRPSNNGYYYPKPEILPATIAPKPTFPTITTQNILKPINTNPTALSTNIQQNIISSSSGYHYSPPSNGLTLPTSRPPQTFQSTASQPVTTKRPSFSNLYPGSTNNQQTIVSGGQNGYYYPKPSPAVPTTVQKVQTTTPRPYFTTQRPTSSSYQYSTSPPGGYTYPRPSGEYGIPTTQKPDNSFYQTTTRPPTSTTSKPFYNSFQSSSNVQPNVFNGGYNYQRPSKPLSLPSSTPRPIYTTTSKPDDITTKPPGYQYYQPSNAQTTIIRPSRPGGYNYPKPANTYTEMISKPVQSIYTTTKPIYQQLLAINNQFSNPTNIQQTIVSSSGYNYEKPSIQLTFPTTTVKPIINTFPTLTTRPSISITTNVKPTFGYQYPKPTNIQEDVVSPGQTGYTYSKPSLGFTYPSAQQPQTTTTRPTIVTTTNPIYQTRPSISITTNQKPTFGYQYPKPTNIQEDVVSPVQSGYTYSKPPVGFTYPTTQRPQIITTPAIVTTERPTFQTFPTRPSISITTNQKPTFGYQYPKPTNIQEDVVSPVQSGYTYSKPPVGFTYPTTQRPQIITTPAIVTTERPTFQTFPTRPSISITTNQKPTFGYQYPKPTNIQENVVNPVQSGYTYSKPPVGFTYPTTQRPQIITTPAIVTTEKPTFQTFPTRPSISITTNQNPTFGYQYPKPTNIQESVINPVQSGYTYSRPSIGLTYPTTQRPPTFVTTRPSITTTPRPILEQNPTNIQQNVAVPSQNGYTYPKPSNSFSLPAQKPYTFSPSQITTLNTVVTQKPSSGYQYPKPTNLHENILPPTQGGYVYQKPTNNFQTTTKPVYTQTVPSYPTTTKRPPYFTTIQPTNNYDNQKPTNTYPNGYYYSKPSKPFPKPSPSKPSPPPSTIQTFFTKPTTYATTQLSSVGYQYPNPTNIQQTIISPSQNGYIYQKPETSFTLPTTKRPLIYTVPTVQTTTRPDTTYYTSRPTSLYDYPNPTNIQQNKITTTKRPGYTYSRPPSTFNYPTSQAATTIRPQTTSQRSTVGYQYPKPSNTVQNVVPQASQQPGYNYQKPSIDFTYPRPTFGTTTYTRPLNSFQYPKTNIPQNTGSSNENSFVYQRPSKPTARPTAAPAQAPVDDGYQYQKPASPFTLPPRRRSAG